MLDLRELYQNAKAWPFEEARKVLQRVQPDACVTFETGYGPSGLPHIGTFGEVLRTAMVRHAFQCLSLQPTRLLCVSDDMDGLRKVPKNIPHPHRLEAFLNRPLTQVPDPFGLYDSFGAHNNHRLQRFLDSFGFHYTFVSATECYQSGQFDEALLNVLHHHQAILDVVLPTLREERRKTYSPFLPISPKTGCVLQVPMEEYRVDQGTVIFRDEDGTLTELPVTGGHCKLQWKVDWGMRWKALHVDYEMAGKDLIDSVTLSSKICRILGAVPPEGMITEHFLDEEGRKISKSVGNGISMEEWLQYAPIESLAYFMYQTPRRAKRLYFDVIPRQVDDYLQNLEAYAQQSPAEQLESPVWHVHEGKPPAITLPLNFQMLLNLASVCHAEDTAILWKFITRYAPEVTPETHPFLDKIVHHAVHYYKDFIEPAKVYRPATPQEAEALRRLSDALAPCQPDPHTLQTVVYEIGKTSQLPDLKSWFSCLYEVLLGQSQGPRMGSFIAFYGIEETRQLIHEALKRCQP